MEAWIKWGIDWQPRTGDAVENVHDKTEEHKRHGLTRSVQTIGMHLQPDLKACKAGEVNKVRGSGGILLPHMLKLHSQSDSET